MPHDYSKLPKSVISFFFLRSKSVINKIVVSRKDDLFRMNEVDDNNIQEKKIINSK